MWYNVYWLYLHSEAVVLLPVCRAFLSWSLSFSLTLWSAVSVFLWLPEVKLPTHCIRAFPSWDERLRLENFLCGTEVGNLPQWASGVLENCCCFVVFFPLFFFFIKQHCSNAGGIFLLNLQFKEPRLYDSKERGNRFVVDEAFKMLQRMAVVSIQNNVVSTEVIEDAASLAGIGCLA